MLGRFTQLLAAACGALFLLTSANVFAAPMRTLPGHVPDAVSRTRPVADLDGKTTMRLAVGLPLRNKAALTNLIEDLYNPASPQFHQYLTVDQFADQFGPSVEDNAKVVDFLQSHGLAIMATHLNRMVIEVSGAASDVEKTFHVKLRVYQHPNEKRTFFAPDTDPQIDADVPVLDVMGLDNYVLPHPMDLKQPKPVEQNSATVTNYAETGSGPGGLYIGKDFRTAYVPGVTNAGDGQYIALVEFGPYWTNDIHTFEVAAGLSTNITVSNIFLDGVKEPPAAGTDAGEQAIDIEMCISMAPNAKVLYYGGEVVDDIYSRIASDNKAKQISCSFGFGIDSTTEQLYQEFVAQGQNFFVASGDSGAAVGTIDPPGAEPYITVVGGTALYTVTPGGAWQQELAWVGSTGGVSTFYAIPNYQQGINMTPIHGSGTMRNFPDVAMMADTVIYIAANNGTGGIGGTSCSSPQWAGFYALANQQAASLGQPPLGFFNPALYALGKSSSYAKCFHDVTVGNTTNFTSGPLKFFAASGYDLCTGWGSPTGSNLINALTGIGTNSFYLYASPVASALTVGGSETLLVSEQRMNGFTGTVALSVSNLPAGVTASFSSASTTSTSILTLTASTNAIAGTDAFTLLGESGDITQAVALTLTIIDDTPAPTRASLTPSFNAAVIFRDNSAFTTGGADEGGNAYSANLLGSALSWNGCLFTEGPANGNDAVRCDGQTITLASGKYSSLQILATAVNGDQLSQPFIVKYTDGTISAFTQGLSDWTSPENYPGESVAAQTSYRNQSSGAKDTVTQAIIYGYSFGLNNNKTVQSIRLPNNADVLVFAMTLANDFTTFASPISLALTAGGKSTCYVQASPINGLAGSISLSASGLPPGVTAAFTSSSTNGSILTLTAAATAQPINTTLTLNGTVDGLVHHVNVGLSVVSPIPGALPVSLASAFNLTAIETDGAAFSTNGGFDAAGDAYSANLLGLAPNWNGVNFSIGASGAPDAVQCEGQTIALPAGQFTGLMLLGAAINASQPGQVFQVNYTDGSSATVTQGVSQWTAAQGYSGEFVALSAAYSDSSGGTNNPAQPVNLYGYDFGLDDSRTVQSITLPNNPHVVVLAMSVENAPTAVSLSSLFNRTGIYTDGANFATTGGLDGHGYAYSEIQLGSTLYFDSALFKFGPNNASDVVECLGQTVTLPTNRYTSLLMLATGVNGNQASQTFTVTYTDGTTANIVQSFSDWLTVTSYSNQFTAASMPYRLFTTTVSSSGAQLYGYVLPLNNTKTVQSLKLPNDGNLDILAISLANTPLPVSLQANYNRAGVYSDGNDFGSSAGVDDDGAALSATLLGAAESWHGALFEFGQPNVTNVVSAVGQTINLPQGRYSSLMMLALGVNGSQATQAFTVNYTNGATTSASVSISDWVVPVSYTGQTTVETLGYRNSSSGGHDSPGNNVYGYTIALNSGNVVKSVKLPNNANVIVLALSLSNYTSVVAEAPVILAQSESMNATNGEPLVLSVSAIGSPTLTYQWQLNGANLTDGGNIAGSSSTALNLGVGSTGDSGNYDVVITNAYGSVTSSVIALNVVFSFQGVTETVSGSTNAVSFSWQTTPGVGYQVQYTTDLTFTNWINLGPPINASSSVSTAIDVLGTDPQRFYRVVQE